MWLLFYVAFTQRGCATHYWNLSHPSSNTLHVDNINIVHRRCAISITGFAPALRGLRARTRSTRWTLQLDLGPVGCVFSNFTSRFFFFYFYSFKLVSRAEHNAVPTAVNLRIILCKFVLRDCFGTYITTTTAGWPINVDAMLYAYFISYASKAPRLVFPVIAVKRRFCCTVLKGKFGRARHAYCRGIL